MNPEQARRSWLQRFRLARFLVLLTPCLSRLPHGGYLGGVFALRPVHYLRINGFPNTHWGWDREDSDIAARWGASLWRP